ncbi:MAG TPA: uroporphyrinogen-III C-methyltransferase [Chloroflexota bacterium]|jgi:uroporphyrinogen III methyltransferase/synthase
MIRGEPATSGKVYLVGAGPGDPGLLTLKGRDCLAAAEVVIYDYLANPALLTFAPETAERIYAGKQAGQHTLTQNEINDLLVAYGRQGKVVVRLKGGDPFLFGRGSEEAEAVRAAGIPFEVVPGVSSALAVPAYAGIPVTHRGLASTLTIATGHEEPGKAESALDWSALAAADTLVLLMGVGNLQEVVGSLLAAGRAAETPIALIRWGTRPEQETVTGTLGTIDAVLAARRQPLRPPAIIVVGDVVALRQRLRWYDRDPLFGRRILVTRSRDRASELSDQLRAAGAIPVELPALAIVPAVSPQLDDALSHLDRYGWVVFSSSSGVSLVVERLLALERPLHDLAARKIAVIGPATAREAERLGLRVSYRPPEYIGEALAAGLPAVPGEHVLLALAAAARPALREGLLARGFPTDQVAVYDTTPGEGDVATLTAILQEGVAAATFASSLTVQHFADLTRYAGYAGPGEALGAAVIACIGPITAAAAQDAELHVDVVAMEHTIPALVEALRRHFAVDAGDL